MTTTAAHTAYAAAVEIIGQHQPTGTTDLVDHLDYLAFLHELQGEIADMIAGEVAVSRANGASWTEVARTLGLSKQGAQQRFTR